MDSADERLEENAEEEIKRKHKTKKMKKKRKPKTKKKKCILGKGSDPSNRNIRELVLACLFVSKNEIQQTHVQADRRAQLQEKLQLYVPMCLMRHP